MLNFLIPKADRKWKDLAGLGPEICKFYKIEIILVFGYGKYQKRVLNKFF